MNQPVQILSYRRVKSNSSFTVSVQQSDGTSIPAYEVLVSNLDPNLTISRLQSVNLPLQQIPPPPPLPQGQYGHPYPPPGPANTYQYPYYHQQQQQYNQPQAPYSYAHPHHPQPYQPQPQPYQQYQQYPAPNPPQPIKTTIGTVSLSSLSSKITFSIHGQTDLKLKRPDILSSAHQFKHPRFGTLSWKEGDLFQKKYKLLDSNKNVLAQFDKSKSGDEKGKLSSWGLSSKKGKGWAFSIFVNADPEFLDWIVVTGLGVVEYRIVSDKEWNQLLESGLEESLVG